MDIRKVLNNRILKNVTLLVSGTAVAQVILMLFQLVLRRLYSPEVFGAFSVYMSIVGILVILSTMRYELAVVLPKDDRKASGLVAGGILISLLINLLVLIVTIIFKTYIIKWLDFPEKYGYWLYFVPLSTFLFSTYQFFNYWLTRNSAFKAISINKVFRRLSEGIVQSGFGVLKSASGLFVGDIIGNTTNIASGLYQAKRKGFTFRNLSWRKIKASLKRYSSFPKYQTIPAVLNTASMLLPVFFINKFYSSDTAGYFDLSRQMLIVPISFITASLSQVLLKELSDKVKSNAKLSPSILKTAMYLTIGILPFMIVIMIWGEWIFSFFFSDIWSLSGKYSAILAPAFAVQFIVSPLSISFTVLEKLKVLAVWQICYFGAVLSLIWIKFLPITHFLAIYTGINILAYSIYFILIINCTRKYDKRTGNES